MGPRGRWIAAAAAVLFLVLALWSFQLDRTGPTDPPPSVPDHQPDPVLPPAPVDPLPAAEQPPDPPPPEAAVHQGVIHGEVADEEGRPVVGAAIEALPPGGLLAGLFARTPSKSPGAVSDAQGRFRLEGLKEGEHHVTIRAAGYVATGAPARPGGKALRIVLSKGFGISGVVIEEATGDAVAGIILYARRADAPRSKPPWQATSAEGGRFAFSGLTAGNYLLVVGSYIQMDSGPTGEFVPVTMGPVQAGAREVRVLLTRGLVISGRIEDDQGAPIEARVSIEVVGLTAAGDPDQARRGVAWSAPDGSFRIRGLPPGNYRLTLEPPAGAGQSAGLTLLKSVAAGSEGLRIRMGRGAAIEGRLEDEDGNPISSVGYIYVYPTGSHPAQGGATALPVGPDGTFKTVALDPEQRYDILATGFPGHDAGHVRGVRPGSPITVVTLHRAFRITGKVLDENGDPVPMGVGVTAFAPDAPEAADGRTATAYTRPGGSFALEGLRDYPYRVRAGGARSAFRAGEAVEQVRPGGDPLVLRVNMGVVFSGRLVDGEGRPVKTSLLSAHQAVEAVAASGSVRDDDGNFTITGLAPGRLTLHAYLGGTFVKLGEFTAPAADVEVVVPPR